MVTGVASDEHPSNDAVTPYVPLSFTALKFRIAPAAEAPSDQINLASLWSLAAVNVIVPSSTQIVVGLAVRVAVGTGLILIVAEPGVDVAVHFLSFNADTV
jgi:hypothetical protein